VRIVIVSNRLPVVVERTPTGLEVHPGSGGLVTALAPVLRERGGLWIGWPGAVGADEPELEGVFARFGAEAGYQLRPVYLTAEEQEGFYHGFSNEIIWPLFHDLQSRCNFVPEYWTAYLAVQRKFAEVVVASVTPRDFIWVQDYHFMGLGRWLRERGLRNRIGFFLHIPFPPPDIFCKLPWRREVILGLLEYDIIGFQTPRDRENFADCLRRLLPGVRLGRSRSLLDIAFEGQRASAGCFPIGMDYREFAALAAQPAVVARVRSVRADMNVEQILLGVDRLDYTKGIPERIKAFQLTLSRYPELHRRIALLQVVVPSREAVAEYQALKAAIERLVTQVNGQFTKPGWVPIHHVFRMVEREELVAYYRAADVALVTPLKDGMNLVAKEYCACQVEGNGVLILSEFAGAAVQFAKAAVLVNPYDADTVAEAIRRAVLMTPGQRRPSMRRLRATVGRQDVYWWVRRFLSACGVEAAVVPVGAQRRGAGCRRGGGPHATPRAGGPTPDAVVAPVPRKRRRGEPPLKGRHGASAARSSCRAGLSGDVSSATGAP